MAASRSVMLSTRCLYQDYSISQRCLRMTYSHSLLPPPHPRLRHSDHASGIPRFRKHVSTRDFSTCARYRMPQRVSARRNSQPTPSVEMKRKHDEMYRSGDVLDFVGLMEGTFIMPTGANLPSSWTRRIQLYWTWLRTRAAQWFLTRGQAYIYIKPRPRLDSSQECIDVARNIYEEMYTAFARGDLSSVETRLGRTFYGSLSRRISQRTAGTELSWRLHKYLSAPERVSFFLALPDRSAPKEEQNAIMQAVIRIHTVQSLIRRQRQRSQDRGVVSVIVDDQGDVVPEDQEESYREQTAKPTVEYVVLHKHIKRGQVGEWQMWGTAQQTTLEMLEQERAKVQAQLMQNK